jgi:NAD(P)-dependent dehydrogenase (short-subunit alcohol dehydrogenase family)
MTQIKTALVTGSTEGLGREVARRLALSGFTTLIHGRDRSRADLLLDEIRSAGGQARFYESDFASLGAVRALAAAVADDHPRLDLLINNAGIGTGGRGQVRETSLDGFELRFAVNYLAGFLLTGLLTPRLRESGQSRIVNVASAAQYPLDFNNLMLTRAFSGLRAYAQSKLAQILLTFDLARELQGTGVAVNCLHPASLMNTRMVRNAGVTATSTVEEGAAAVLHLATTLSQDQTGRYFNGMQEARAHEQAYDEDARRKLKALSRELCGSE